MKSKATTTRLPASGKTATNIENRARKVRPGAAATAFLRPKVAGWHVAMLATLASIVAVTLPASASADTIEDRPGCSDVSIPVASTEGAPNNLTMNAQLCLPVDRDIKGLQFLVHGISYNHHYWDSPRGLDRNSYVSVANSRGYATLAVDRIGYGLSSHPNALDINYANQAWQLHQAMTYARAGNLGVQFDNIAYVGHSSGTALGWEVAKYGDFDALVASGMAHGFAPLGMAQHITELLHPAVLDEQFRELDGNVGYLTTAPGTRSSIFHSPDVDPRLVDFDEANKDLYSPTELATGLNSVYGDASLNTSGPVLAVVGENDTLICGPVATDCSSAESVKAHESVHYPATTSLTTEVLAGAGHSINYAPNAQEWFALANDWLDTQLA